MRLLGPAQIRSLADEGTTILLTTHYLEEAEALCEAEPDELSVLSWSSPEPPQALRASSAARESALRARGRVRVDMRSLLLRCHGSEPTSSGPL